MKWQWQWHGNGYDMAVANVAMHAESGKRFDGGCEHRSLEMVMAMKMEVEIIVAIRHSRGNGHGNGNGKGNGKSTGNGSVSVQADSGTRFDSVCERTSLEMAMAMTQWQCFDAG